MKYIVSDDFAVITELNCHEPGQMEIPFKGIENIIFSSF